MQPGLPTGWDLQPVKNDLTPPISRSFTSLTQKGKLTAISHHQALVTTPVFYGAYTVSLELQL